MPVTDFEEGSSWESAVLDPLSDYVPEESWMHGMEKLNIIGFPDEILALPEAAPGDHVMPTWTTRPAPLRRRLPAAAG